MTQKHSNETQIIYEVVRGERPCTDLFQLGVKIEKVDDTWHFEFPQLEPVKLQISDVAYGLVKHRSNPDGLKKWARLILAGSFIDLSNCEEQTGWEVLLNALWDAMDTGQINNDALGIAEELAT